MRKIEEQERPNLKLLTPANAQCRETEKPVAETCERPMPGNLDSGFSASKRHRFLMNFLARWSVARLMNYRRDQLLLGSVTYPLPVGMRKRPSWSRQPCSKPSWILLSTWQLAQSSSTGPSQYLLPLLFFPQFLEPFP